jgi:hypothetical protein
MTLFQIMHIHIFSDSNEKYIQRLSRQLFKTLMPGQIDNEGIETTPRFN